MKNKNLILYLSLLMILLEVTSADAQPGKRSFRHLSVSDGLSQSSVIDIVQDKNGMMWFGTRDGLNKYDGHKFTIYNWKKDDTTSISSNDILSLIVDKEGDLWVGTLNGLNKYDYSNDRFLRFKSDPNDPTSISDNSIWSLFESSNGEIWVGTEGGLNRYNKTTRSFTRYKNDPENELSLSHNYVLAIYEDKDGFLWAGTARGLNKLIVSNSGKVNFNRFSAQPLVDGSLSDDFIQTIAEDKFGDLWIGTKNGGLNKLSKSTGKFKFFQHDSNTGSSISNNDVRSLAFDKVGNLWVGTYNGLNYLKEGAGNFSAMYSDKNDPYSLSKNSIKTVFIDDWGTIWIGTYYGGVNMIDDLYSNFKNYKYKWDNKGLQYDVISSIVEDDDGQVFIGTEGGGVNILNRQTGEFKYITKGEGSKSLSSNNVKSLYLDDKKNLWIGTFNGGLNILDLQTGKIEIFRKEDNNPSALNDDNVYSIFQIDDNLFLIGTFGGGLNLFNRATGEFKRVGDKPGSTITNKNVRNIFEDSDGNLWVGTQYGLNFLSASDLANLHFSFKHYFFDYRSSVGEFISTIFEDSKSRLWVGTNESGLSFYNEKTDKFERYDLNPITGATSNIVHGILEDKHQNLWISTNNGILKLNPETKAFKTFDESNGLISNEYNNNACLETRDGSFFFGSLEGLTTFHPDSIKLNKRIPQVVLTDLRLFGESVEIDDDDGLINKIISETENIELDYDQAIFSIEFATPNFINPSHNQYAYRLKGLEEKWNYTNSNIATYTIQKSGDYTFEVKGANNDGLWNTTPTVLRITVNPAPWRTWWAFTIYAIVIGVALALLVNIIYSRSRLRHKLELEHLNLERQESLNQMKLQFFTNISHEFRTPLTLILGPLEQMLANYKGGDGMFRKLSSMERNANRLLRLIDQLMDFRKLENSHLQVKAAEIDIVDFVEKVYQSFRQYADLHNLDYEFISEAESEMVWFDWDKMERVIFNLISNAFKYTPDGGSVKVVVSNSQENIEIAVIDTGVGMASQHLDKIFERFYEIDQSDRLLKTKYNKGTGIGLALAKGIIDLHAGNLEVESKENKGSTFTVRLPKGNSHFTETQLVRNSTSQKNWHDNGIVDLLDQYTPDTKVFRELPENTPTVLIVEDNVEVSAYLAEIFRKSYNILQASNGNEGLNKAIQHIPDLIVSDVMMPEMSGIELCSHIKSNIRVSHIPVILLTARTSLSFKHEGLEVGADDYINKPFNVKELRLKAKNLISSRLQLKEKFSTNNIVTPGEITVTSVDEELLEKALHIAEENISNEHFDVSFFCEELGVSRTMLFTKIKAWTNLTPNEFILVMRMKRAAQLLEQNKLNVSQIGFKVGFKNPKYFSKCFQKHFSETPSAYAKRFSSKGEVEI